MSFDEYCLENGLTSAYYRIPKESLDLYNALGKKSVPVADEGIVDVADFSLGGVQMKGIRKRLQTARDKHYTTTVHEPPIGEDLLKSLKELTYDFKQDLNRFGWEELSNHLIITVQDKHGVVSAFLDLIPDADNKDVANNLIMTKKDTPEGVMVLLLVQTIQYLKEKGYQTVNLGMAPLSDLKEMNFTERVIRFVFKKLKLHTNLKPLRLFKEKFASRMEQRFLVYSSNFHLPKIVNVLKRLSKGK